MKILSLNLWNINEPLNVRMNILKEYITSTIPDFICFQEVSKIDNKIQVEYILKELQYEFSYCLSGFWKEREEGLLIATKANHRLILNENLPLIKNDMQRILMGIEVIHPIYGLVYIFNTHLAYHIKNGNGRMRQIEVVLKYISSYIDKGSVILCGDLNEDPYQGEIYQFIKNYGGVTLKDTCEKTLITFSRKNRYIKEDLWPDRKLDYIFYSGKFNLKSSLVLVEGDKYGSCSDHYGLLAEDD